MGILQSKEPHFTAEKETPSKSPGLTDQQIEIVRRSWEKVIPNKEQHGRLLFYKLFDKAPHLTNLFPFGSDLSNPKFTEHALNVMNAVDFTVNNLDNPEVLIPKLQELGRAHAMFELTMNEFRDVGQALLSVLEEGLGDAFTPKLKTAWADAYNIIAEVMMAAITDYNAN